MVLRKIIKKHDVIPHKKRLLNHHFFLTWWMHIQNNDMIPVTSQNYIWCPVINKFYSLNKETCSQWMIFAAFSTEKKNPLLLTVSPLSHLTSCTPIQSNLYLAISLATFVSEPALCRLLKSHVPNLMSLSHCLGHTKGSVQGQGTRICFKTRQVFTVRSC